MISKPFGQARKITNKFMPLEWERPLFQSPITPEILQVAQENYNAAQPPFRSRNITGEIAKLLHSQETKAAIVSVLTV